ncbi:MAG: sulfopyruvate decarboxylase subunit beta [Methanobacterium sp.]
MERIQAIKKISESLEDELVICNIGFPSRELYEVKDSPTHFYMLGSMGMASSIALGVALSSKRKVVAFDGDGSVLMNMGSLVTIFSQNPENMVLVVFDNQCYGSTGSQCTYTTDIDLHEVAKSVGFKNTFVFKDNIQFKKVLNAKGPVFVHMKVKPGNADVPVIDMEPEEIKERFMEEIRRK